MKADVAVVMAAYDAADTLDAALASVAAQSRAADEVVVVDDCSHDDTRAVAERWRTRLPLRVLAMDRNSGPARARHEGVQASRAPTIALLDADDYWLPDHLALCLRRQGNADDVAVGGRGVRWSPLDETPTGLRPPVPAEPPQDGQLAWIVRDNGFSSHAVFSRAAYERVGGFTARDAGVDDGVEDWDLWIRLVRAGVQLQRVPRATFLYRTHATSLSNDLRRMSVSGLRMLDRLERDVLSVDEREQLQPDLRAGRARLRLAAAFACAQAGEPGAARAHARGALRGERAVALRAAAIAVAPQTVGELRTRRGAAVTGDVTGWSAHEPRA